ncbi:Mitogen-activated protein kinase kinase kinase [Trema orientale]|uniref:Mitogen-activated protein kinase kinase kinase n=1 Tax=Trema orientale TaxID=63057 RepID=A0A2P5DK47_TREOI|nr:Mitogen-activated protein kinase kinase kinase [Trema orientale]
MQELPSQSQAFLGPWFPKTQQRDWEYDHQSSELSKSETNLLTIPTAEYSPTTPALLQSNKSNFSSKQELKPGQKESASTSSKSKKKNTTLFIAPGSGMGFLVKSLCTVSWLVLRRLRKTKHERKPSRSTLASSLPGQLCRRFSLSEIEAATNRFHQDLLIGKGGFGNVYRGYIDDGSMAVAVKRLKQGSQQGAKEFVREIEMLSQLRYVHLVSLIGFCDDNGEMILVYEYVANGTLRHHLYGSDNDPLSWKQRLEICIGAARGLHYLHTGVKDTIIHRDVKSSNILLDDKWVAKVGDFGLSKVGMNETPVSTMVMGTFGYLDPEYDRTRKLTEKSDVYSFGVLLFEVLCARKPIDMKLDHAQKNLASWARTCIRKRTIQNIIDPVLMGRIAPECFKMFVELAESCVRDGRIQRPTMGDVMEKLEFVLELQEKEDADKERMNPGGVYSYPMVSIPRIQ